tara:strand:+ start:447 stop:689 length:243 start_codon:yes stop_codon:yes gene_type:complete
MKWSEVPAAIAEMELGNLTSEQLAVVRHLAMAAETAYDERARLTTVDESSKEIWTGCADASQVLWSRVREERQSREELAA